MSGAPAYRAFRRLTSQGPSQAVLLLFLLVQVFPLYFLLINVFKDTMDFARSQLALPERLYLGNFSEAWTTGSFPGAVLNSLVLTVTSTFGRLFLGSLAAFAMAKLEFVGRRAIYYVFLGSMFLPQIVVIIPLFKTMMSLGLLNTYMAPIIIYIGYLQFTTYVLTTFFQSISQELIDAARIDGCGDFQIYRRIVLPLSTAALASLGILSVLGVWTDFMIPLLFLNKEELYTLMVRIVSFQGRFVTNLPVMLAGLVIAVSPILILFIFFQRYFRRGITLGSFR